MSPADLEGPPRDYDFDMVTIPSREYLRLREIEQAARDVFRCPIAARMDDHQVGADRARMWKLRRTLDPPTDETT